MGTHPSGPSMVHGTEQPLREWIQQHPESLGATVRERFGPDLPFLFKVRSLTCIATPQQFPEALKAI